MLGTWQGLARGGQCTCSTARRAERHDALHTVVRDVDTGQQRRDRSGSLAVSLRGAERGPGRLRHGEPTRRHADSARRRRARGERIPGAEAGDRGCRGPAGHRSPDPASGVARRSGGARRRAGDRARGQTDLQRARRLRQLPPEPTPSADSGRSARGWAHRHARRRRPPPGLLGGDDELRACAGDDPTRRRDGIRARRRRVLDHGLRRRAPQPAVRHDRRATRRRIAARLVLRRLRAATRALVLAERRRRRRQADAELQDRSPVEGHGDAHRPGG